VIECSIHSWEIQYPMITVEDVYVIGFSEQNLIVTITKMTQDGRGDVCSFKIENYITKKNIHEIQMDTGDIYDFIDENFSRINALLISENIKFSEDVSSKINFIPKQIFVDNSLITKKEQDNPSYIGACTKINYNQLIGFVVNPITKDSISIYTELVDGHGGPPHRLKHIMQKNLTFEY